MVRIPPETLELPPELAWNQSASAISGSEFISRITGVAAAFEFSTMTNTKVCSKTRDLFIMVISNFSIGVSTSCGRDLARRDLLN